jgi:hypothetical protein
MWPLELYAKDLSRSDEVASKIIFDLELAKVEAKRLGDVREGVSLLYCITRNRGGARSCWQLEYCTWIENRVGQAIGFHHRFQGGGVTFSDLPKSVTWEHGNFCRVGQAKERDDKRSNNRAAHEQRRV